MERKEGDTRSNLLGLRACGYDNRVQLMKTCHHNQVNIRRDWSRKDRHRRSKHVGVPTYEHGKTIEGGEMRLQLTWAYKEIPTQTNAPTRTASLRKRVFLGVLALLCTWRSTFSCCNSGGRVERTGMILKGAFMPQEMSAPVLSVP